MQPLNSHRKATKYLMSLGLASSVLLSGAAIQAQAQSQEMIPRALLVNMARNQFSVLCQSEAFASCMGFTSQACLDLSESAITQCLLPLPKEISPDKLDNSALESCPAGIFADAGYDEEKAGPCFDKAMEAG